MWLEITVIWIIMLSFAIFYPLMDFEEVSEDETENGKRLAFGDLWPFFLSYWLIALACGAFLAFLLLLFHGYLFHSVPETVFM